MSPRGGAAPPAGGPGGGAQALLRPGRPRILRLGVAVCLLFAALHWVRPDLVVSLERRLYDAFVSGAAVHRAAEGVVVVDLDERSLARFGQWPWPRALVARLLQGVAALGARSVAVDVLFPEPDRPFAGEDPGTLGAAAGDLSGGDAALARVLAEGPFVLGYTLLFGAGSSGEMACPPHPLPAARLEEQGVGSSDPGLFRAAGAVGNLAGLWRAAPGSGFLNATPDGDGVLRRLPLLVACGERVYPSLALAAWMLPREREPAVVTLGPAGVRELRVGDRRIPLDARGSLLLGFFGAAGAVPRVSAADVLEGAVSAAAVGGRIALVGTTAAGLERGLATPVHPLLPGVEVHAAAVADLISGSFVRRPAHAFALELLSVLAAGLGVTLLFCVVPVGRAAAAAGAAGVALWLGAAGVFRVWGVFVSPLVPLLTVAGQVTALAIARSLAEERRARRRGEDLLVTQSLMLESLSSLAESRSHGTGVHALRTRRWTQSLCARLARHPGYGGLRDEATADLIARLAPIHDIGKAQVPDGLLLKSGALSEAERAVIRKHALYGRETLERAAAGAVEGTGTFVAVAKDIVYTHHERWDGTGYPEGLAGEEIPVPGRVVALVDSYDALVSARAYRRPFTHAEAVGILAEGRGTHFDPAVVDAFLEAAEEWRRVGLELAESADEEARFGEPGGSPSPGR